MILINYVNFISQNVISQNKLTWKSSGDFSLTRQVSPIVVNTRRPSSGCQRQPDLEYLLGGFGSDSGNAVTTDASAIYVAGNSTASRGSPLRAFTTGTDTFVEALNATTGASSWHTFLGGAGCDTGSAINVNQAGNLVVTGASSASWGKPAGSTYSGGTDGDVALLSPGGQLVWNMLIDGPGNDYPLSVATDYTNLIFVAGYTDEDFGPYAWAVPGNGSPGIDGFAAKIDPHYFEHLPALHR